MMPSNFRDHAANERTFLAWVRTTVAVVGFGLAVGRLGSQPSSPWSEVALLITGGIVVLLSYIRMRIKRREIDNEAVEVDEERPLDLVLLSLVCSMFALMAFFALHLA